MPEVEIEDYETKAVTREGYACDKCNKGAVDEPLSEDEVTTVLAKHGVHDRLTKGDNEIGTEADVVEYRCEEHADVKGKIEYEANVKDRMGRYKTLVKHAVDMFNIGLITACLASAVLISGMTLTAIFPEFWSQPENTGMQWIVVGLAIFIGSLAGSGAIFHLDKNT